MKKSIFVFAALILTATVLTFTSCQKDKGDATTLQLRLTDGPGDFEEVNVDIRDVKVKFNDDTLANDGWIDLNVNAGVYDLLRLQNGIDTVLATGNNIPQNAILREIRIYLGSNNTVKVNGQMFPLQLNEGDHPKLKIKVAKKLNATFETVVIDFDAGLSIKQEGNGTYRLIPVLKIKP
ncbi:MAG: DUF4382 domain-containing protein [Ferruginibacter sp.]|nr:DUF4382 domain-containing protein [Ferruginibacter sp.]